MKHAMLVFLFSLSFAAHARGGISGGGGNVIVTQPPTSTLPVAETNQMIQRAKNELDPYLHFKIAHSAPNSIFTRLFQHGPEIFQIIGSVQPMIQDHSTCFGNNSTPSDGSTISQPGTICMSAMDISRKVNADDVLPQSAALLLHEYSELYGFTEGEAVQLQTEVLNDFRQAYDGF